MRSENSYSNIHVWVLVRPADSLFAVLPAFLREYRYAYSICPTLYHVLTRLGASGDCQPAALITRPAMLTAQAAAFLVRQYPRLRMFGWIERNECISDLALGPFADNAMIIVNRLSRLEGALAVFCKSLLDEQSRNTPQKQSLPSVGLNPAQYELSDEEVEALLGAG